jgi:N-acyl-D-aspartate/D-glutamate deacylase
MAYDVLIKGGRIYDGSGLPSYLGDVAVQDGRIVDTGRINGSAKRVVNADGLAVSPGFHRLSHPSRCPALGSIGDFFLLPRCDYGHPRQLRVVVGAV